MGTLERFRRVVVCAAAGLMLASAANAQIYRYPDRRGDRYGYGIGPVSVVQRVMRNLQFAARSSYPDGHERDHFDRAISELQRFEDRWNRQGRFDTGNLDRAIDNMKHLAGARQLDPRSRRTIAQDVQALRDLRSQRGRYRY